MELHPHFDLGMTWCSFCGRALHIHKYAAHLEKSHPNGRAYIPHSMKRTKSLDQLLAEGGIEVVAEQYDGPIDTGDEVVAGSTLDDLEG